VLSPFRALVLGVLLASEHSWAAGGESPGSAPGESSSVSAQSQPVSGSQPKTGKKKGRRSRVETEAEGTEAPNRFEADPVIKSRYQLNGEPLEVDPD
jgi:hypothetical protein